MKRILNIGCRYNKNNPERIGGVVVLFEQWVEYCSSRNNVANFTTIDSNKSNYRSKVLGLLSIVFSIYKYLKKHNGKKLIVLHSTYFDVLVLAPITLILCRLAHAKFIIRKFAGDFEDQYNKANVILKKYIHYLLSKTDLIFWESKSLVEFGKKHNVHSEWFPNVRESSGFYRDVKKPFNYKFVFISRVEEDKGIIDLAKSIADLGEPYSLDIYGPVNGIDISKFEFNNVKYKGILPHTKVAETLSNYDILCLPTYWKGEGYPGIIIEALSVGIPVISTFVGGIPELINDKVNGFLIPPRNIKLLKQILLSINNGNYAELSQNALHSFNQYNAEIINNTVLNTIINL